MDSTSKKPVSQACGMIHDFMYAQERQAIFDVHVLVPSELLLVPPCCKGTLGKYSGEVLSTNPNERLERLRTSLMRVVLIYSRPVKGRLRAALCFLAVEFAGAAGDLRHICGASPRWSLIGTIDSMARIGAQCSANLILATYRPATLRPFVKGKHDDRDSTHCTGGASNERTGVRVRHAA